MIPRWRPGRRRRERRRRELEEVVPLSEIEMTPEMWDHLARASMKMQENRVPPDNCPECGREVYKVRHSEVGLFLIPARVTFGESSCPMCGSRW